MRARRIRQVIESHPVLTRGAMAVMHLDALSMRAVRCLPELLKIISGSPDQRINEAAEHLKNWDGRMEPDRVGASIFEVFFARLTREVARSRFDDKLAPMLAAAPKVVGIFAHR
jgi:acyl-homoserine lactone acylase PvdQ